MPGMYSWGRVPWGLRPGAVMTRSQHATAVLCGFVKCFIQWEPEGFCKNEVV